MQEGRVDCARGGGGAFGHGRAHEGFGVGFVLYGEVVGGDGVEGVAGLVDPDGFRGHGLRTLEGDGVGWCSAEGWGRAEGADDAEVVLLRVAEAVAIEHHVKMLCC